MKNPSSTKAGPGRYHWGGHKKAKSKAALAPSTFGALWLGQHTNPLRKPRAVPVQVNASKVIKPPRMRKPHAHPLRDAHGAYTCTGPMMLATSAHQLDLVLNSTRLHNAFNGLFRRKWLAGISAWRGY